MTLGRVHPVGLDVHGVVEQVRAARDQAEARRRPPASRAGCRPRGSSRRQPAPRRRARSSATASGAGRGRRRERGAPRLRARLHRRGTSSFSVAVMVDGAVMIATEVSPRSGRGCGRRWEAHDGASTHAARHSTSWLSSSSRSQVRRVETGHVPQRFRHPGRAEYLDAGSRSRGRELASQAPLQVDDLVLVRGLERSGANEHRGARALRDQAQRVTVLDDVPEPRSTSSTPAVRPRPKAYGGPSDPRIPVCRVDRVRRRCRRAHRRAPSRRNARARGWRGSPAALSSSTN